jgi:hypothetical protein
MQAGTLVQLVAVPLALQLYMKSGMAAPKYKDLIQLLIDLCDLLGGGDHRVARIGELIGHLLAPTDRLFNFISGEIKACVNDLIHEWESLSADFDLPEWYDGVISMLEDADEKARGEKRARAAPISS